jgi:hypothetical protein
LLSIKKKEERKKESFHLIYLDSRGPWYPDFDASRRALRPADTVSLQQQQRIAITWKLKLLKKICSSKRRRYQKEERREVK